MSFTSDQEDEDVIEEEEYVAEEDFEEEEQFLTDDDDDDGDDSEIKSSRKNRSGRQNGMTRVKRRRVFHFARSMERQRGEVCVCVCGVILNFLPVSIYFKAALYILYLITVI